MLVPVQPGDGWGGNALQLALGGGACLCTQPDRGGGAETTKVLWQRKWLIQLSKYSDIFRYVDISAGLVLFISFLSLHMGARKQVPVWFKLFFVLSSGMVGSYWVWMGYLRWGKRENEASKEVSLLLSISRINYSKISLLLCIY